MFKKFRKKTKEANQVLSICAKEIKKQGGIPTEYQNEILNILKYSKSSNLC